jgi:small subunit ribosomal protein S16
MGQRRRSPPGTAAARQRIRWEKTTPVAVKIKLKRLGKIRAPYYRIVVADARTKRDGRAIEEIGKYHPKAEPSLIEVDSDRAQHWLSVGALPTDPVRKILEITGDWQKFKGLPGTEGTLKTAAPREDRKEIFAAAVKETLGDGAAASKGRAGREERARSGAGREAEPSARGGRASAAAGRTERPARAKAGEGGGDARASTDDAKAGGAKADDAKAGGAKADDAKAGGARGGDAKGGDAKGGGARAGAARGRGARGGTAKGAARADDSADAPAGTPAAAETAAEAAGPEPASGD